MDKNKIDTSKLVEKLNVDTNNTIEFIENALISEDKEKYLKMFLLLIKRGIIKNNQFSYVENFLNQVFSNKFHFKVAKFDASFYKAILNGNYELALVNYEILCMANELFGSPKDIFEYKNFLENDGLLKEKLTNIYNEVIQYGLKIVETNKIEEEKILKIFSKVRSVICFHIDDGINKKLVIRHYPFCNEKTTESKNKADQAYDNGQYHTAMREYRKLLCIKDLYSYTYMKIALCYYYTNNIQKAIEYITVANEVLKGEKQNKFSYNGIYRMIISGDKETEYKPKFTEEDNIFDFDEDDNFGLGKIDDITDFIVQTGLDVESACEILVISKENMNILRLVYARNFYAINEIGLGDCFIKAVEESKYKTAKILRILEDIKKSKKIYSKKSTENLSYNLKLKPSK